MTELVSMKNKRKFVIVYFALRLYSSILSLAPTLSLSLSLSTHIKV